MHQCALQTHSFSVICYIHLHNHHMSIIPFLILSFLDLVVFVVRALMPPPRGRYLTKFNKGRLRLEVQPLTLLYTTLAEKVPLIPFIEKRYPFHLPTLGSLVFIFV